MDVRGALSGRLGDRRTLGEGEFVGVVPDELKEGSELDVTHPEHEGNWLERAGLVSLPDVVACPGDDITIT